MIEGKGRRKRQEKGVKGMKGGGRGEKRRRRFIKGVQYAWKGVI